MKLKTLCLFIISAGVATASINTYALDAPTDADRLAATTNCLTQKLREKSPPIAQSKITQCGDITVITAAQCLGVSQEEYNINYIKFCSSQLINTQCVAQKMNITLSQYTACDQEPDPGTCFKRLGYTPSNIVKLSDECGKAGSQ